MINESFFVGFAAGFAAAFFLVVVFGLGFAVVRPWVRLKLLGGRGSLVHVLAMRLRGTPPMLVIEAYTSLLQAGERVTLYEVESQYVANRTRIMDARGLMDFVREQKREA